MLRARHGNPSRPSDCEPRRRRDVSLRHSRSNFPQIIKRTTGDRCGKAAKRSDLRFHSREMAKRSGLGNHSKGRPDGSRRRPRNYDVSSPRRPRIRSPVHRIYYITEQQDARQGCLKWTWVLGLKSRSPKPPKEQDIELRITVGNDYFHKESKSRRLPSVHARLGPPVDEFFREKSPFSESNLPPKELQNTFSHFHHSSKSHLSPSIYQERVYSPPSSQRRRNDYDADLDELQMANFIRQQEDEARVSIQRQVSEAQEDGMKARLPQNKRYFSQCSPPGSGYVDPLEHSPTELQHSIFMDDSTAQKKNDEDFLPFFRQDEDLDLVVCRSVELASADYSMKTSCNSNIIDFDTGVGETSTWIRKNEDQSKVWRWSREASVEMQLSQKEKNYQLDEIDLENERGRHLDLKTSRAPLRNDNGEHQLENRKTTVLHSNDIDTGLKELTHLILAKKHNNLPSSQIAPSNAHRKSPTLPSTLSVPQSPDFPWYSLNRNASYSPPNVVGNEVSPHQQRYSPGSQNSSEPLMDSCMNSSPLNLCNMPTDLSTAQGPFVSHQDPYNSNETAKRIYDYSLEVDRNAVLCSNNLMHNSTIRSSVTPPRQFDASSDVQAHMRVNQRMWEALESREPERVHYLEDSSPRETESQRSQRCRFLGPGVVERGTCRLVERLDQVKPDNKESLGYGEVFNLRNLRGRHSNDWAPEGHAGQEILRYGSATGLWEHRGREGFKQFDAWAPLEPTDQQSLRCRRSCSFEEPFG